MTTLTQDEIIIRVKTTDPISDWTSFMMGFGQMITLLHSVRNLDTCQMEVLSHFEPLALAIAELDDETRILLENVLPKTEVKPYPVNED